ncbi:uncharacterized protein DS421_10g291410 [Arachis hypogaea]|nr:uncharacterized protein DS421_10g291410 [Arachis hypogaea]
MLSRIQHAPHVLARMMPRVHHASHVLTSHKKNPPIYNYTTFSHFQQKHQYFFHTKKISLIL